MENEKTDDKNAGQTSVHFCSFSSGLDDLTRKEQGDIRTVLTLLAKRKCFSVFEATANNVIANMMDRLGNEGYIRSTGGSFPWLEIEITEKGQRYLAEGKGGEDGER